MTEYDFSPEAYERYLRTQNRVANWVSHTEQHRHVFEAAVPGAPGVPSIPYQQSPPIPEHYRASPEYSIPPAYHRSPPSSSSGSGDSYVHVAVPQLHRPRPPPPPIYAPPIPPRAPIQRKTYPSPVVVRMDGDRLPSSPSRRRHLRSKSHSHPHRSPPPLVTPVYTSPAASPFVPPPPIIYMPSQGYPAPPPSRPVISPRELYRKPSSPRKPRPSLQPPTPPDTPLTTSSSSSDTIPPSPYRASSPNSPTSFPFPLSPAPAAHSGPSISGPGGSRLLDSLAPWQEDQKQNHRQYPNHNGHMSTSILPGLDQPYISRNLQGPSANNSQPFNYHHRSYLHPYHEHSRRSCKSSSESYSQTPINHRPQPYARHSDPCYDKPSKLSTSTVNRDGVISISVPPRHPVDDRELQYSLNTTSYTFPHSKRVPPLILHAPQPMRHSDLLTPGLRASPRA